MMTTSTQRIIGVFGKMVGLINYMDRMKKWLRQIYRQLPIVGELRQIRAALENLSATLQTSNSIAANYFFHTTVLRSGKYSDPANLLQYERQMCIRDSF